MYCLTQLFWLDFAPSYSRDVYWPEEQKKLTPKAANKHLVVDRFNVYGPLRTVSSVYIFHHCVDARAYFLYFLLLLQLLADFDSWYVDAKELAETTSPANTTLSVAALSTTPVSFHYVSEVESQLLYQFFKHLCTRNTHITHNATIPGVGIAPSSSPRFSSWQELHQTWPRTDEQAGHYSRHLAAGDKGEAEARLLFHYFTAVGAQLANSFKK